MVGAHKSSNVHQTVVCDGCLCDGPTARYSGDCRREAARIGWSISRERGDWCPRCAEREVS
jgi:hypothetical protein